MQTDPSTIKEFRHNSSSSQPTAAADDDKDARRRGGEEQEREAIGENKTNSSAIHLPRIGNGMRAGPRRVMIVGVGHGVKTCIMER